MIFSFLPLYGMNFVPGDAWCAGQGWLPGSPEQLGLLTPGHSAALIFHFLCSSCVKPRLSLLCRLSPSRSAPSTAGSPCSSKAVAFPHSPSSLLWDRAHLARELQTGGSSVLGSWQLAVPRGQLLGTPLAGCSAQHNPVLRRSSAVLRSPDWQPGIPLAIHITTMSWPVQSNCSQMGRK